MDIPEKLQGNTVCLEEVLKARENRFLKQKELLKDDSISCIVCVNINMPGPVKLNFISKKVFEKGLEELQKWPFEILKKEIYPNLITGPEAYFSFTENPKKIKLFSCNLEEKYNWSRLLDIDVIDKSGKPLNRNILGFPERTCIVCGKKGKNCASRRLHSIDELFSAIIKLTGDL